MKTLLSKNNTIFLCIIGFGLLLSSFSPDVVKPVSHITRHNSVMVCKIINCPTFEKSNAKIVQEYILKMHSKGYRLVSLTPYNEGGSLYSNFIIVMRNDK
jgi:hypothetical protein